MDLPSPSNPGVGCAQYCAVLNAEITDSDCHAFRGSNLACPSDCPHYPFGLHAYDTFLELEANWTPKAAEFVFRSVGRDRFDQLMGEGAFLADDTDSPALESGLIHAVHYGVAFERLPAGGKLADLWEQRGYLALSNDERVITHFHQRSFVTVVQILEIIDHQQLRCLDALAPDCPPFLLIDRGTAVHASVGARLLSWLTHYPNFGRLGGMAREIPTQLWEPWQHAVQELFEKDRVREPKLTLRSWLSRRAGACADLIDTLSTDPGEVLSASDFHHSLVPYPLQAPFTQIRTFLHNHPDFHPIAAPDHASTPASLPVTFSWIGRNPNSPPYRLFHHDAPQDGIGSLAILHLFDDRLILETFTHTKSAFASRTILELLAGLISPPIC